MTDKEIRAARLNLLDERLETIRAQSYRISDYLKWARHDGTYTQLKRAELTQLEAEARLLETERANLLEET